MRGTKPIANKYLQKQWDTRDQLMHKRRLRSIRSSNYTNSPFQYTHVRNNKKKERQKEERVTEIERENRILIEKMSKLCEPRSLSLSRLRPAVRKPSLNREQRKNELEKITQANQSLLVRLKNQQPFINVAKLHEDRKKQEARIQYLTNFPRPTSKNRPRSSFHKKHNSFFTKEIVIDGRNMLAHIEESRHKISLCIKDQEKPEQFELELTLDEAKDILGGKIDYVKLLSLISFEKEEIVLNA